MPHRFPIAYPGDVWTAREVNELRDAVTRLDTLSVSGGLTAFHGASGQQIAADRIVPLFVSLAENISADEYQKSATVLRRTADRSEWEETSRNVATTVDPQQSVYLAGERHLLVAHPSSGMRLILPGVQWHLAKTDEAISAESAGSVTIWQIDEDEESASSIQVTAHNYFGRDVAADKRCMILQHLQSRRWYIFAADC